MERASKEPKSVYLEQYGSTLVTNNYLRVAVAALSIALVASIGLSISTAMWARNQKPVFVRIDDVGRATPIDYRGSTLRIEAPEVRYFLGHFVQMHFSRLLGSVEKNFAESLYFLDARLAQAIVEEERKTRTVEAFVREGAEENDIEVKNIVLQDLRVSPMKASVDFEKIFYSRGERRELRRERFTGSFEFVVQETVPNGFVLVNPLGLTLTYFRVDAAFKP